jgi:hypothetical protein
LSNPILDPRASQGHFDEKFWVQGGWFFQENKLKQIFVGVFQVKDSGRMHGSG